MSLQETHKFLAIAVCFGYRLIHYSPFQNERIRTSLHVDELKELPELTRPVQ